LDCWDKFTVNLPQFDTFEGQLKFRGLHICSTLFTLHVCIGIFALGQPQDPFAPLVWFAPSSKHAPEPFFFCPMCSALKNALLFVESNNRNIPSIWISLHQSQHGSTVRCVIVTGRKAEVMLQVVLQDKSICLRNDAK
jgi:hypothetical protein